MAHKTQMDFVRRTRERFPERFTDCRVLEIGSLIIAGSVRGLFKRCRYEGCDLGEGEGVDIVCPAHKLEQREAYYDTIISCEALEHDSFWSKTLDHATTMLSPGGLLVLTWAGQKRKEHGTHDHTPQDAPFTNGYYYAPSMYEVASRLWGRMSQQQTEESGGDRYYWGVKA